jgi:V/A-type H+-transporting ATPase subunit K
LAVVAVALLFGPTAFAADDAAVAPVADPSKTTPGEGLRVLGIALGAGLAIVGAGFATAKAQSAVGAGGTGAMAEKPELFTSVLILFAIPETIVVFGFVVAVMILGLK